MTRFIALSTSFLATLLRAGRGTSVKWPVARQPERTLEYYGFEACPFGRLVREAFTELDLDVRVFPCPEGGQRFRPQLVALGGKMQVPFLVDPNTGRRLYESAEIVRYLAETYGSSLRPARGLLRKVTVAGAYLASGVRGARGLRARPSKSPAKPLELYSYEASPYSRLVREVLDELELPYLLRNCGQHGHNRAELKMRAGKVQVPYLLDPNAGVAMLESAVIIDHLQRHYAA